MGAAWVFVTEENKDALDDDSQSNATVTAITSHKCFKEWYFHMSFHFVRSKWILVSLQYRFAP